MAVGKDLRAVNVACVDTAVHTLHNLTAAQKLDYQERFLKAYIAASDAPFTFYRLGQ